MIFTTGGNHLRKGVDLIMYNKKKIYKRKRNRDKMTSEEYEEKKRSKCECGYKFREFDKIVKLNYTQLKCKRPRCNRVYVELEP